MDRKMYWRFVFISAAHLFAVQLTLPVLAPYFSQLGYSEAWISFVFGLFPLVSIFAGIIIGELSESIGRSWIIRVSLLVAAVVYGMYYSGHAWAIIIARLFDAAAYTALTVLFLAKIEDQLEDSTRGRFTGLMLSLQTGLRLFAPVIGGYLADRFIGYPFFLSIGIMLALAVALRQSRLHHKRPVAMHPWKSVKWFITHPQLRAMALLGPFMHVLQPLIIIFVPLLIVNELGLSYAAAGLAIMFASAGSLLQFFFGELGDRVGNRKLIVLGTTLKVLSLISIPLFVDSYTGLLLAMGCFGIGSALWNVSAWSFMSEWAEREDKEGLMAGAYMSIARIGELSSFWVAGVLVAMTGVKAAFLYLPLIGGIGIVASAALFYVGWLKSRTSSVA